MDLNVSELDLLPAQEQVGTGPPLLTGCCLHCFSSLQVGTGQCDL